MGEEVGGEKEGRGKGRRCLLCLLAWMSPEMDVDCA